MLVLCPQPEFGVVRFPQLQEWGAKMPPVYEKNVELSISQPRIVRFLMKFYYVDVTKAWNC